jgi:hypothetical protein
MKVTISQILTALQAAGNGEQITLTLASEIYPRACIEAAGSAFRDFCTVECRESFPGALELVWSPVDKDAAAAKRVADEFLNYCLQSSVGGGLGAAARS